MKLNAYIPPNSRAATTAHRALMMVMSLRTRRHRALSQALRDTARDRLPADERAWIERIEARRCEVPFEMAVAEQPFGLVAPEGPPPTVPAPPPSAAERLGQSWEIVRWTTIPPVWGRFLMRLMRELGPVSCLELGTGLGLSGAYQAAALELNANGRLTTVDAHAAADIAQRGFDELGLGARIQRQRGLIDDLIGELLPRLAPIDYAFLDADHSETATLRHFEAVLPYLADGAVVVLDDITQTAEMKRAWMTVAGHSSVGMAVGLRRFGVVAVSGAGGQGP